MEATELLSDLWDKTTNALNAFSEGVSNSLVRVFGNSNERQIRRMQPVVERISALEPTIEGLSDDVASEHFPGSYLVHHGAPFRLDHNQALGLEGSERFANGDGGRQVG